jgi:hypothetical protein
LFITGCATCNQATFMKPTAITETNGIKLELNPYAAYLTLADKVKFTIKSCSASGDSKLCASIEAPPNTHIRIDNDVVSTTILATGQLTNYKLGAVLYQYTCLTEFKGKRTCSSSEESPTGKPITIVSDREETIYALNGALMEWHSRSFPVTHEFIGAVHIERSTLLRAVSPEKYRSYDFTLIDAPMLNTAPITLKLPKLWVDGQEYILPEFKIATVTEELCFYHELM